MAGVAHTPTQLDLTRSGPTTIMACARCCSKHNAAKDGVTSIRLELTRPRMISIVADGPTWVVTIADTVAASTEG